MLRISTTMLLFAIVSSVVPAQSLTEAARKEKKRREEVTEGKNNKQKTNSYGDHHLRRARWGRTTKPDRMPLRDAVLTENKQQTQESGDSSGAETVAVTETPALAALDPALKDESKHAVQIQTAGVKNPQNPGGVTFTSSGLPRLSGIGRDGMYLRGGVFFDAFRTSFGDGLSANQMSARLKLEAGSRPGEGWRIVVDARDRVNVAGSTSNKPIIYDARLVYEDLNRPFSMSVGQMNLYQSAGVGQLLGGVAGFALSPSLTVGGYGGVERNLYSLDIDPSYQKFGFFGQYRGERARSASVSYNRLRFNSQTERSFMYASGLIPVKDVAVIYGSAEYEVGNFVSSSDRLTHLFLNARYNLTKSVDVTGYISNGKGLDFHRFLVEQSQNPNMDSPEIERFYFSQTYGARVSWKVNRAARLYLAQRESERKDAGIRNHTTQFGGSLTDVVGTGISVYGNYNMNRGGSSESNAYRISVSRDFGPVAWTTNYSTTFNGVRFDLATGRPEIIRLADRRTISNDLFFSLSRALSLSAEHDLTRQGESDENTLFFRLWYRF